MTDKELRDMEEKLSSPLAYPLTPDESLRLVKELSLYREAVKVMREGLKGLKIRFENMDNPTHMERHVLGVAEEALKKAEGILNTDPKKNGKLEKSK